MIHEIIINRENRYGRYFLSTEAEDEPEIKSNTKVIEIKPNNRNRIDFTDGADDSEEYDNSNQDENLNNAEGDSVTSDDSNTEPTVTDGENPDETNQVNDDVDISDDTDYTDGNDNQDNQVTTDTTDDSNTDTEVQSDSNNEPDTGDNTDYTNNGDGQMDNSNNGDDTQNTDDTELTTDADEEPVTDDNTDFTDDSENPVDDQNAGATDGTEPPADDSDPNAKKGPGLEYDSTRKYSLFLNYEVLINALNNYITKLENNIGDDMNANKIIKTAVVKLREIKDLCYEYMIMKFEASTYIQSLLFYQNAIIMTQSVFDLLQKMNKYVKKS